jgi:glucose-1-phosphate cytidylyltransferase
MKIYSHYGINDFIICCGYKGYVIKEYFVNYFYHNSDITVDLSNNSVEVHNNNSEKWKVTLVDTGLKTMTGGRIKRIRPFVGKEPFLLTYGDGVGDINISESIDFHLNRKQILTVTSYRPQGKFGSLAIDNNDNVTSFDEKPSDNGSWINAGYFVCKPEVFDYLDDDSTIFEGKPLSVIAKQGNMNTYKHYGFWKPMDTLKDNKDLNEMWDKNIAPWKLW